MTEANDSLKDRVHSLIVVNNEFENYAKGKESLPDLVSRLRAIYGVIDEARLHQQIRHFAPGRAAEGEGAPAPRLVDPSPVTGNSSVSGVSATPLDAQQRGKTTDYFPQGANIGRGGFMLILCGLAFLSFVGQLIIADIKWNSDARDAYRLFVAAFMALVLVMLAPLRLCNLGVQKTNRWLITLTLFVPVINLATFALLLFGQRGAVIAKKIDFKGWISLPIFVAIVFGLAIVRHPWLIIAVMITMAILAAWLILSEERPRPPVKDSAHLGTPPPDMRWCPFCQRAIQVNATRCMHCWETSSNHSFPSR